MLPISRWRSMHKNSSKYTHTQKKIARQGKKCYQFWHGKEKYTKKEWQGKPRHEGLPISRWRGMHKKPSKIHKFFFQALTHMNCFWLLSVKILLSWIFIVMYRLSSLLKLVYFSNFCCCFKFHEMFMWYQPQFLFILLFFQF